MGAAKGWLRCLYFAVVTARERGASASMDLRHWLACSTCKATAAAAWCWSAVDVAPHQHIVVPGVDRQIVGRVTELRLQQHDSGFVVRSLT